MKNLWIVILILVVLFSMAWLMKSIATLNRKVEYLNSRENVAYISSGFTSKLGTVSGLRGVDRIHVYIETMPFKTSNELFGLSEEQIKTQIVSKLSLAGINAISGDNMILPNEPCLCLSMHPIGITDIDYVFTMNCRLELHRSVVLPNNIKTDRHVSALTWAASWFGSVDTIDAKDQCTKTINELVDSFIKDYIEASTGKG